MNPGTAFATGHVFTYGSLMFETVWSRVVAGSYRAAAATLSGFRRQRVRGEDYPSLARVEEEAGAPGQARVDGVLYLDVGSADLTALDIFEGEEYRRIQVPVVLRGQLAGGPPSGSVLPAHTYLFIADHKVEAGPWDPQEFERSRIERFLRDYPPPRPARP